MACYLCGGLQTCGTLEDPHDAFLLGAQLARECTGLVRMLELARMYEKGDGIWRDLMISYSWYMVLMKDYLSQDLRAAALNKPHSIAVTMENIAPVEAMARAWKQQSGIY